MAAYQPIASRLTLRLQVGSDEWGSQAKEQIHRRR